MTTPSQPPSYLVMPGPQADIPSSHRADAERINSVTLSCQPRTASPDLNPGPDISGCRTAALPHPTPIGPTTPHCRHRSGQVLPFRRRSNFACIRGRGVGETTNQSLQG